MVKKIEAGRPVGGARGVDATKGVQATEKTSGVKGVQGVQGAGAISKVSSEPLRISGKNKEQILQLVAQEVDKLFSENALPEKDRVKVEKALRMVIESAVDEDSQTKL